jgi:hypothetical protein
MLFEQAASNSKQRMAGFFNWIQICSEGIPSEDFKDLDIVTYNVGNVNKFFKGRGILWKSLILAA